MCLSLCAHPKLHSVHCLQSADVALLHVTDICHINNTSHIIKFLHQRNIGKFHVYFFLLTNVYFLGSSTTTNINDTTNHKEGSWMTGNSGPNDVTHHWAQVCFIFSCFFFSLIYIRSFNYYLRWNTTWPTQANEDQQRPTKANKGLQRPTKAYKGLQRPTKANEGQ